MTASRRLPGWTLVEAYLVRHLICTHEDLRRMLQRDSARVCEWAAMAVTLDRLARTGQGKAGRFFLPADRDQALLHIDLLAREAKADRARKHSEARKARHERHRRRVSPKYDESPFVHVVKPATKAKKAKIPAIRSVWDLGKV